MPRTPMIPRHPMPAGSGGGSRRTHHSTHCRHHARSERNSLLRQMGRERSGCIGTPWRRSNICRRNVRHACTTLHAYFSILTRDSSSCLPQALQSPHSRSRILRWSSLSVGSQSSPIPRKVSRETGPSRLSRRLVCPDLRMPGRVT